MPSPVEIAVDTYIRMWSEPDPTVRRSMLDACFAADGRMVTRSREIRGRTAFGESMTTLLADPEVLRIRVTSPIDAKGTTFRFHAVVERRDGTIFESFDAGQIDADGKISLILTFAGPLAEPVKAVPDNTAVRVAMWRALHLEVDSPPHVFADEVGLKLAAPDDAWRSRPDMSPFTRAFRAAIVARGKRA